MPLFDFRCRACGHLFETLVRPNTDAPSCPKCQSTDLEKQLTTFAVNSAERISVRRPLPSAPRPPQPAAATTSFAKPK